MNGQGAAVLFSVTKWNLVTLPEYKVGEPRIKRLAPTGAWFAEFYTHVRASIALENPHVGVYRLVQSQVAGPGPSRVGDAATRYRADRLLGALAEHRVASTMTNSSTTDKR